RDWSSDVCSSDLGAVRPALLSLQYAGKVQIPGLVVGRIGIGNIVGQHRGTLGTESQRFLMQSQGAVKTQTHGGNPHIGQGQCSVAKYTAIPVPPLKTLLFSIG